MKLAPFALLPAIFCGNLAAEDVKIVGTVTQAVRIPLATLSIKKNSLQATPNTIKKIKLLKIQLSTHAEQNLVSRAENAIAHTKQFAQSVLSIRYPEKVELGMNNVPVLNQGMYGTCVTFANTAAIDAALNKGDYISQLCQLQLGNYLEKNGYTLSGWEGSWGRMVLSQMDVFGIIRKTQQQEKGCGGLTSYPMNDTADITGIMSIEEYRQLSENLNENIFWSPILDVYQALSDRIDTNKTLNSVKASLNEGDRLTFGVLLMDFELGLMGAVGKNKAEGDTWVLTPEIARDTYLRPNFVGHEMVITGYDDDAVAIDAHGYEHRGLFTLRNSWGDKVGDHGNFYMSYDYFKLFTLEVQRIHSFVGDGGDEGGGDDEDRPIFYINPKKIF